MNFTRIKWWWRTLRGLCPKCNSDAPAIDTCTVCHSYRHPNPFPPTWATRMQWLQYCEWELEAGQELEP